MANIPLFEALCDALERRGEDYDRGRPSAVADPQDQRGLCVPCVQVRLNHDLLSNKTSIFLSFIFDKIFSLVRSVQAILSEDSEDDLTWLRYWVVLALVSLVEMVVDPMVGWY